jgi:hypothetical protein
MRLTCQKRVGPETGKQELVFAANGSECIITQERINDFLGKISREETEGWLLKVVGGSFGPLSAEEEAFVRTFAVTE